MTLHPSIERVFRWRFKRQGTPGTIEIQVNRLRHSANLTHDPSHATRSPQYSVPWDSPLHATLVPGNDLLNLLQKTRPQTLTLTSQFVEVKPAGIKVLVQADRKRELPA